MRWDFRVVSCGIQGLEGQGFPFFVFAHGGRHEPILQEAVPIPFFRGGFGLAVGFGLLRRRFIAIGMISQTELFLYRRLFFFKLIIFQDRVGFQGLGNFPHQFHTGKLQQLDGLLQFLGHDERLSKF